MKISDRNLLEGTVESITFGQVNAEVVITVAPGANLNSIMTKASAERLELAAGKGAYATIKSSDVMVAVEE